MTWRVTGAARADIGARARQEDAFGISPSRAEADPIKGEDLLAVVTDGMGGHAGGEVAGRLACETFLVAFAERAGDGNEGTGAHRLDEALQAANTAIAARAAEDEKLAGMGCTLVAAWLDDAGLRWVSVGDSLLLLVRAGKVRRLNADHSLGAFLDERARRREMTNAEAARNPYRNALRSALTGKTLDLVDLRKEPFRLAPGDVLILASDGIATLTTDEIARHVEAGQDATPADLAERLIESVRAKRDPSQDNTTAVVLKITRDPACPEEVPTRVLHAEPGPNEDTREEGPITQPFLRAFGVSNGTSRRPLALVVLGMGLMFAIGWILRAVLE